ncbi:MAG: hypothetical protein ACQETB_05740 [Halobacteriota archaeon]
MSTTSISDLDTAVTPCRRRDVTPVEIDGDELRSTAPGALRELKATLAASGYQPTTLRVSGQFDADCSIETQREAERLREYVRAAAFLGVTTLSIAVESVASVEKTTPALEALAERSRQDGVCLELTGSGAEDVTLDRSA